VRSKLTRLPLALRDGRIQTKQPDNVLKLYPSAQLLLKRSADISRRYFLNIRLSRPENTDRALGVLDSRLEKGFDFPDAVGSFAHHRSELIDKSH
jgi:hypothetical protein